MFDTWTKEKFSDRKELGRIQAALGATSIYWRLRAQLQKAIGHTAGPGLCLSKLEETTLSLIEFLYFPGTPRDTKKKTTW
jgi:hypothetical protein